LLGSPYTLLLIEQPSSSDLRRVEKLMAVALLVRFDLPHVELWWHGRHERIN